MITVNDRNSDRIEEMIVPSDIWPSAEDYASAAPFPHAVIDDAFDISTLRAVAHEISRMTIPTERNFYGTFEKRRLSKLDDMPAKTRAFVDYLHGPAFLHQLERMTGIEELIPDLLLEGAGLHQIGPGGYLKVHADFNWHRHLKLYRRLNVLVYLNEDWNDDWEGKLELWDRDMSACHVRIAPRMNRMVVFSTTDDSFHGHPEPVCCPPEVRRNSIALYYYTKSNPGVRISTLTDWRERPGEQFNSAEYTRNKAMLRHPILGILGNHKTVKSPRPRDGSK